MLSIHFPSGSLEFWFILGRGLLHDQLPVETLGIKSVMNSSDGTRFHMLLQLFAEGIKCIQ